MNGPFDNGATYLPPGPVTDELARVVEELWGTFNPLAIVERAADPNSPLHGEFEWNDEVAAHNHRYIRATRLIHFQLYGHKRKQ